MSPFMNMVKNGLLLFAVGIAVAFVAPVLANLIGPTLMGAGMAHAATSTATALWTGLVFGSFGAIHTLFTPIADKIFGEDKETKPAHSSKEAAIGRAVIITNTQLQPNIDIEAKAKLYTQILDAQRAEMPGQVIVGK